MTPNMTVDVLLGALTFVGALALAGCGGDTATAAGRAEPAPAPAVAPPSDPGLSDADGYVLRSDTEPCDGYAELTVVGARAMLPAPASYAYTLTYGDGRTTFATVTVAPYDAVVKCSRRSTAGAVGPAARLSFTTKADLRTDDGLIVGRFDVAASLSGTTAEHATVEWRGTAEVAVLTGTFRPTLVRNGYDGHAVHLGPAGPTDQAPQGTGMTSLALDEITYKTGPYSQEGKPIGALAGR